MDKKKIIVFATGWSSDILEEYVTGLASGFSSSSVDIYLFLSYALVTNTKDVMTGELNIFNLPNVSDFDGAAILANGMDMDGLVEKLTERCTKANIPVVCTGRNPGPGTYFVGSDNFSGAKNIASHIVNYHKCTDVFFFAGARDNPDSNIRRDFLRNALQEVGSDLPEEKILYTNWEPRAVRQYITELVNEGRRLPQAFVCANDILALNVCEVLSNLRYTVPDDVLVTGYDNEMFGNIYAPTLTTVDQSFTEIGSTSAQILLDLMEGIPHPQQTLIPSKVIIGCSCGCSDVNVASAHRENYCKGIYLKNVLDSVYNINVSVLEKAIIGGSSYNEFINNMKDYSQRRNFFEGSNFHLILEPSFAQSITDINVPFNTNSYSEEMEIIVSYEDGSLIANEKFRSANLVPQINPEKKENRFFLFLPLHEEEKNLGYLILGDDISKTGDFNHLYGYINRFCLFLEMFRNKLSIQALNNKLIELNSQDALTHVKNRSAYIKAETQLNERINNDPDTSFAIAMFDVNNLKQVNDRFGHEYGDQYIIGCCHIICTTFKHSPVFRMGGDEFCVILTGEDYENRDELIQHLRDSVEASLDSGAPLYCCYSIASGISMFMPGTDTCVSDVFTRADGAMYTNKKIMKAARKID